MTGPPTVEPLEAAVLGDLFSQKGLRSEQDPGIFSEAVVSDRYFTKVGFFTDFGPAEVLRVGNSDYNDHWVNTRAILNTNLSAGFLIYIYDGRVACIEGFVYGDDEWPDFIFDFKIENGMSEQANSLPS